jgi:hypothetical protein
MRRSKSEKVWKRRTSAEYEQPGYRPAPADSERRGEIQIFKAYAGLCKTRMVTLDVALSGNLASTTRT